MQSLPSYYLLYEDLHFRLMCRKLGKFFRGGLDCTFPTKLSDNFWYFAESNHQQFQVALPGRCQDSTLAIIVWLEPKLHLDIYKVNLKPKFMLSSISKYCCLQEAMIVSQRKLFIPCLRNLNAQRKLPNVYGYRCGTDCGESHSLVSRNLVAFSKNAVFPRNPSNPLGSLLSSMKSRLVNFLGRLSEWSDRYISHFLSCCAEICVNHSISWHEITTQFNIRKKSNFRFVDGKGEKSKVNDVCILCNRTQ